MRRHLSEQRSPPHPDTDRVEVHHLRRVGVVLLVIGMLAIALPQVATIGARLLTAALLTVWGAIGLWLFWGVRPAPEWQLGFGAFGLIFAAGVLCALFPYAGIGALTVMTMLSFLIDGMVSILFGLGSSACASNWGWLVLSGVCALAAGLVMVFAWPCTGSRTLSLLVGLNFLSTGISLVLLARSSRC